MYYIYHIKGVKIGCSTQPETRVKQQNYVDFEILEEHNDIYFASDREQELQKEYGYRVDKNPYWKSYELNIERRKKLTKEKLVQAGKIAGNNNVESGVIYQAQKKSALVRKGKKMSEESRIKMSIAAKSRPNGNNWLGRNHNDDSKLKMSIAASNRIITNETRIKLSIGQKNRWLKK